jgi:hypothetical protein
MSTTAASEITDAAGDVGPGDEQRRGEELTAYEAGQVRAIAAWKSLPPHPAGELFKRIAQPGARQLQKLLPEPLVKRAIDRAYGLADRAAQGMPPAGRPLEELDAQAIRVGVAARRIALAEGVVTGAGGVLTTLADVPVLFVLSLWTIIKIGRCYGYLLDQERARKFVLGVLIAAVSGSLAVRLDRLGQLRDIEEWFLEETQEEILTEEAAALLFQLEIFGELPGVGAISGGLLNLGFMKRVEVTARRVFQERWLRDQGKVEAIAPLPVHAHVLALGWTGTLRRVAHASGYAAGYTFAFPFVFAATLLRPPARVPGAAT